MQALRARAKAQATQAAALPEPLSEREWLASEFRQGWSESGLQAAAKKAVDRRGHPELCRADAGASADTRARSVASRGPGSGRGRCHRQVPRWRGCRAERPNKKESWSHICLNGLLRESCSPTGAAAAAEEASTEDEEAPVLLDATSGTFALATQPAQAWPSCDWGFFDTTVSTNAWDEGGFRREGRRSKQEQTAFLLAMQQRASSQK